MDFRSSVTSLFQPLTKTEIQSLKKFIGSPYFNTNKNISAVLEEILKFYPEFENKNLNKEYIYSKVFKGKPYSDTNMRWIVSEINYLTENWFAQKRFDENKLLRDFYVSEEYMLRIDEYRFKKSVASMRKNLNSVEEKDYLYYFYQYLNYSNELNSILIFKKDKKSKDLDLFFELNLKAIISYINHFIVGITFDYHSAISAASKYLKNGISKKINTLMKLFDFEKVAEYLEEKNEDGEYIKGTINLLNMYLYPENELLYEKFKEYLLHLEKKTPSNDIISFYHNMISFLRMKILGSAKKDYFRNELFRFSEYLFENNLYSDDRTNSLNYVLYKLTLLNIFELHKIEYAEEFIKKYCLKVSANHRENAINFSSAYLSFYKKDFESTLNYMNKTDPNFLLTDLKILKIACFAELNYHLECANEVKSFRKYLKTSKFLSPETRKAYEKFLFFIPYISQSGKRKIYLSKKKFLEKLNEPDTVYLNMWLKDKINGL